MREKKTYEDLVLSEARKDTITIAWGRFNPPTTGHEKLINTVAAEAKKRSADYRIYPTKTSDIKKNPLTFKEKVRFMRQMFRRHARNISAAEGVNTLIKAAQQLEKEGYKNLILVAGSDRIQEFNTLLNKYNGSDYNFDSINVVSAGDRDPDAEDVSGMSASKMRAAASAGNFNEFKKGVPNKRNAKALYDAVRTGMRVVETFEKDGILELFEEVEEEHKLLEEGLVKKAVIGTVVAATALKTLKKMEKKRKIKKLKATKGPDKIEEPKEISVPGGIEGPKFDRLLRFGLSVGGTGDIPLTKRAFRNFDYSQTNPILRKKVFATTQRAFRYLLHDEILYHRLVVLLQRKQQFQEDTNAMKFNEVRTTIDEAEGPSPLSTEHDHPEKLNFIGKFPSGDYTKSFIDDINRAGLAKITWVSPDGREVQFHLISSITGQEVGGGETPDAMRDSNLRQKQSSIGFGSDAKVINIAMKHGGKISRFDGDIREGIEEESEEIQDKIVENIIKRSWKSEIAYDILSEVYLRGLQTWDGECKNKENMLPEQWAFSRVNSFVAGGKSRNTCDIDLWEEHTQREAEENSEMDELFVNEADKIWRTPRDKYAKGKEQTPKEKKVKSGVMANIDKKTKEKGPGWASRKDEYTPDHGENLDELKTSIAKRMSGQSGDAHRQNPGKAQFGRKSKSEREGREKGPSGETPRKGWSKERGNYDDRGPKQKAHAAKVEKQVKARVEKGAKISSNVLKRMRGRQQGEGNPSMSPTSTPGGGKKAKLTHTLGITKRGAATRAAAAGNLESPAERKARLKAHDDSKGVKTKGAEPTRRWGSLTGKGKERHAEKLKAAIKKKRAERAQATETPAEKRARTMKRAMDRTSIVGIRSARLDPSLRNDYTPDHGENLDELTKDATEYRKLMIKHGHKQITKIPTKDFDRIRKVGKKVNYSQQDWLAQRLKYKGRQVNPPPKPNLPSEYTPDHGETFSEARMGEIARNVRKGTAPYTVVAHKAGRVVGQESTKIPNAVPAFVRTMKDTHKGAKISVEDRRGRVLHTEEVENIDEQFTLEFLNESFEIEFLQEEHGAGFEGTPKLDKKYRKDTPGQANEESPPSERAERFIKKNKSSFNKLYGSKGKERLYATAWKMHNKHWK